MTNFDMTSSKKVDIASKASVSKPKRYYPDAANVDIKCFMSN